MKEIRINPNKTYILNPNYVLRNDVSRAIIATSDNTSFMPKAGNLVVDDIVSIIHPNYAIILSFFDGKTPFNDVIEHICSYFQITPMTAECIVRKMINNPQNLCVEYDSHFFYLPKHILVEKTIDMPIRNYSPNVFIVTCEVDLHSQRLNKPIYAALLINTKCVTDCIYCYADKRKITNCTIPFRRIQELIAEAKSMGISSFDIHGGELFLYPEWESLLKELYGAGYNVYISTKYPLNEEEVMRLVNTGAKEIQISLDSIYEDDLVKNLKVTPAYRNKILNTISLLSRTSLNVKVKSVITNPIFDKQRILDYLDYFDQFPNVKVVELTAPSHSLYKTQEQFSYYRLSEEQINQLISICQLEKDKHLYELRADIPSKEELLTNDNALRMKHFKCRSSCSGNKVSFLILPNGDVTVCEETYFNPNLKMGSILNNSILDVWNSSKAKGLFYMSQLAFPMDSPCRFCKDFVECRHDKGICWTDVMAAYGEDNWMMPSPECPLAPTPKNQTKIW